MRVFPVLYINGRSGGLKPTFKIKLIYFHGEFSEKSMRGIFLAPKTYVNLKLMVEEFFTILH